MGHCWCSYDTCLGSISDFGSPGKVTGGAGLWTPILTLACCRNRSISSLPLGSLATHQNGIKPGQVFFCSTILPIPLLSYNGLGALSFSSFTCMLSLIISGVPAVMEHSWQISVRLLKSTHYFSAAKVPCPCGTLTIYYILHTLSPSQCLFTFTICCYPILGLSIVHCQIIKCLLAFPFNCPSNFNTSWRYPALEGVRANVQTIPKSVNGTLSLPQYHLRVIEDVDWNLLPVFIQCFLYIECPQ